MKNLFTPTAPRVIAWVLGVVALVSPALAITQWSAPGEPDTLAVVLWLVIPNAIAGFALSWRWTDTPDPLASAKSGRSHRWVTMVTGGLLDAVVVMAIQFFGTLIMTLVLSTTTGHWGDVLTGPILFALGGGIPLWCALLLALLVVAPIRVLADALGKRVSGRRADSARPAFAIMLLLIVAIAVTAVLAGYTVPNGRLRSGLAGFVILGALVFTVQGTPQQQLFAWIARALIVLLVATFVWLVRIAARRRAARNESS